MHAARKTRPTARASVLCPGAKPGCAVTIAATSSSAEPSFSCHRRRPLVRASLAYGGPGPAAALAAYERHHPAAADLPQLRAEVARARGAPVAPEAIPEPTAAMDTKALLQMARQAVAANRTDLSETLLRSFSGCPKATRNGLLSGWCRRICSRVTPPWRIFAPRWT